MSSRPERAPKPARPPRAKTGARAARPPAGKDVAIALNLAPIDEPTPVDSVPAPPEVVTEGKVDRKRGGRERQTTLSYVFSDGGCREDVPLKTIPRLARDDGNLAWVDLSVHAQDDMEDVARLLKLDPITVEATLDDWSRPRVDVFPDYFYMSVTVVQADQPKRKLIAGELNIVVGDNLLLTAHKSELSFQGKILQRLKQSPEVATLRTAYALYIVLEELVEYYEGLLEHIDEEIEQVEERALTETSDAFLSELLALKRYIFVLGRFAEQHRSVFAVLTRPDFTHISGADVEPYFKDLQDNLARVIDKVGAARGAVTEAFDVYVSQVSHRTNKLIRVLTLISTVVLPATLVVGFFSTNFTNITQLQAFPAFIAMLVVMVLLPAATLLFIRQRHLI